MVAEARNLHTGTSTSFQDASSRLHFDWLIVNKDFYEPSSRKLPLWDLVETTREETMAEGVDDIPMFVFSQHFVHFEACNKLANPRERNQTPANNEEDR